MATKLHITEIEACDEAGGVVFTAKLFEADAVEIVLSAAVHTATSWRELADDVGRAIDLMFWQVRRVTPPDDPQ